MPDNGFIYISTPTVPDVKDLSAYKFKNRGITVKKHATIAIRPKKLTSSKLSVGWFNNEKKGKMQAAAIDN